MPKIIRGSRRPGQQRIGFEDARLVEPALHHDLAVGLEHVGDDALVLHADVLLVAHQVEPRDQQGARHLEIVRGHQAVETHALVVVGLAGDELVHGQVVDPAFPDAGYGQERHGDPDRHGGRDQLHTDMAHARLPAPELSRPM
jgi:hypothetical protein